MSDFKTSIIIPAFNHYEDALRPCLASVQRFTRLATSEVIVVANGCTDGTEDRIRDEFPWCRVISFDEPLGYPKAVNRGVIASTAENVVLLNSDTVLLDQRENEWIDTMSAPFADGRVGITGPMKQRAHEIGHDFMVFFCVMIRREVFVRIGLLDEAFGWGAGEDTAFCIEAARAGYEIRQVPGDHLEMAESFMVGHFPIYHKGEVTVHSEIPNWAECFAANGRLLKERYGPKQ